MASTVICDSCGRRVEPHGHYVVEMDVYADPSLPPITTEELEEKDPGEGIKDLIEQMKGMNEEELLDQVHRRFEFKLCRGCQVKFLANPLGRPRGGERAGDN